MPTLKFNLTELMQMSNIKDVEKMFHVLKQFKGEIKGFEGDEIIVELEPDRPDILSMEGLSRAIRNYMNIEVNHNKLKIISTQPILDVYVRKAYLRPYIACAIIKDIEINNSIIRSLMNMQEALHLTIGRNRKKVAIGIHDYDEIVPPITYTEVLGDEKMIPLDSNEEMSLNEILEKHPKGKIYSWLIKDSYPVYMDSKGIFSFPPVINSERTRVKESTKNIFIELTGIDKRTVSQTLNIIVYNILDRGGKLGYVTIHYPSYDEITPNLKTKNIKIKVKEINKLLGIRLKADEVASLLKRMLYNVTSINMKGEILLEIPPFRVDVIHPVDVIEDVAIAYGYDNILPELPSIMTIGKPSLIEILESKIREIMIGMGFQEVMTFTLTNVDTQISMMNLDEYNNYNVLKLSNPVTYEYNCYRRWIIPNIMHFISQNKHATTPQKIFEIGYVAIPKEERIFVQRNIAVGMTSFKVSFSDIKEVLMALINKIGLEIYVEPYYHPSFINGRTAIIKIGERKIGLMGEIHPKVLNNFEIEMPVVAFEITLCQLSFLLKNREILTIRDGVIAEWF
ncbi:MAG: phenylalanine--tRNA ligase subunit beta [Nitrososphaeria archaeon]